MFLADLWKDFTAENIFGVSSKILGSRNPVRASARVYNINVVEQICY